MMTPFDEPEETQGSPQLLPVQLDFLERGRLAYTTGAKRVLWQAPCGAGKTWISAQRTLQALERRKTVLHIAPRRKLVDQMLATLLRFGVEASPIMEGRRRWSASVYCASRDTLLAILKADGEMPVCDLIDWDEAHVEAREIQRFYLQHHPGAFWSGMTATPVMADGSSLAPPWQGLVCMAPTSEMIALGRLVPVKVFNPDAVGRRRRKGEKVKPVGDPVAHWKKYAEGLPTVAYAATVADSRALVRKYLEGGVSAEHVDADTPEGEREDVFERSRRGLTQVISNCAVLTYGVDLPWLQCCQILRGCNSLVLWMQANGRTMRAFRGKSVAITLDHAGAAHEFGLPDADFDWELGDERKNLRVNKDKPKPKCCNNCSLMFTGPVCPNCGWVVPKKKRKSLLDSLKPGDAVLTEFVEGQREALRADILERLWKKCFHIARAKGRTMGAAAAMFSKEAKVPPWEAGLSLNLPSGGEWKMPAKDWSLT